MDTAINNTLQYKLSKITPVEATVNELVRRYDGIAYDVTTTKGMATARADRAALRTARGNLEAARKEEKAEVLTLGRFIDSEAARIGAVIAKYEDPLADLIKAEDDKKEQEKIVKQQENQARIAKILGDIEQIKAVDARAGDWTAEQTATVINNLSGLPFTEAEYNEFLPMAIEAKGIALDKLSGLYSLKVEQEAEALRVNTERAAREVEEEAERQERDRLAAIEAERIAEAQAVLAQERAEFEKQKAEAEAIQAAKDNLARVEREELEAAAEAERVEAERVVQEQMLAQAAIDMEAAATAEIACVKAVEKAKKEEKARKLAEAKLGDATAALKKILAILDDGTLNYEDKVSQIQIVAEANV